VDASVRRLREALTETVSGAAFTFGVTPETLLVAGIPLPDETVVADTARLLHDRDVLQITFLGEVPIEAVHALLRVLTTPADDLRAAGGPSRAWDADGHPAIAIEQIDYEKLLEDRDVEVQADRHDDVWRSIVNTIATGQGVFNEAQQRRLLEISGDVSQIGELATAVSEPKCNIDGSPLITTQAATVLAVFRHLTGIVQVMEPERLPDVMRNIASASTTLNPHVVMQMMQSEDRFQESPILESLASAFDDDTVARLLATALARDGNASARLAQVFDTIAPDVERKQRVLTMTRSFLSEQDFGRGGQFKAAWATMEGLLLNYDEKPYVSTNYQAALAGAGARAEMLADRDLPPELPEWVETLGQDNVRTLSVLLITDLLRLEEKADRAAEIARDVSALGEDLLLSGAFDDALVVIRTLKQTGESKTSVAHAACRAAAVALGGSAALREAAGTIGDLDDAAYKTFAECCSLIGASSVQALQAALETEDHGTAYKRAYSLARTFGAPAVPHFARMAEDQRWFVQRTAAELLGTTRSTDAIAPLQMLLRRSDERVLRAAVAGLAGIEDAGAARAIQTVLRAASGGNRTAVIDALVAERDPRVVPMLSRILTETDPFGPDHGTVLDALEAVKKLGHEGAVPAVVTVMRKKRFFGGRKAAAFKTASVAALRAIGGPKAQQALADAASTGDRRLKKAVAEQS
jgi:HEAT repeat protein